MKECDKRFEKQDIINKIRKAEAEVEKGAELLDGKDVLIKLRLKYIKKHKHLSRNKNNNKIAY